MTKLTTIEGIGPAYAEKLTAIGITSTELLLKKGATAKGRQEIAEVTGISGKHVLSWINYADLFRIKGVSGQYAELLEASGVNTVVELSNRNAANLTQKMAVVNEEKKLVRQIPSEKSVSDWVAQAKALDRVVHY